ncbi:MAG: dehydrogenase [Alphaproteobacteria bacterium]|nr:dehydrogenase [Alphaproteobacteria bacterium]
MPKLKIDGVEVEVPEGYSILQACETVGVEIPRFCYHDKLTVPANCRMCLVEQTGAPKPVASCAIKAADNMDIKTRSDMVHKARKGVMEFLLINHPLDCPICDQGGECDLQDQALSYGFDRSRYQENKRAVQDKNLGPLVKTSMNRCIHCTRCIRFGEQIGGVAELGLLGRGEDTEVGTFVEHFVTSELSGNITDICPVGALLSKPYSFKARSWELRKTESIDVMDAVGSHIRVDSRQAAEVLRVLPRLNEEINEDWISDRTRFAYDGLKYQRLDQPYIRKDGKLVPVEWDEALNAAAMQIKNTNCDAMAALVGDLADCESIAALKDLMVMLGAPHMDCRTDGAEYEIVNRGSYIMNSGIAGIDQCDAVLLVGTFPRHEATMVNARIRRAWVDRKIPVGVIGENRDHSYPIQFLGAGPMTVEELAKGGTNFAAILEKAQRPMIIVGAGTLARQDGTAIQALLSEIATRYNVVTPEWNGMNTLQLAASRVGALDLGFLPQNGGLSTKGIFDAAQSGRIKTVFALAADEFDPSDLGDAFVIYQGHHGDRMASRADIILPGSAYTEKNALYVNTEGRVQQARQAVFPPGMAKEDWKILRALSEKIGKVLPYNSHGELRRRMADMNPVFAALDVLSVTPWQPVGKAWPTANTPFVSPVRNYYQTCAISRASITMAKCTEAFLNRQEPVLRAAE